MEKNKNLLTLYNARIPWKNIIGIKGSDDTQNDGKKKYFIKFIHSDGYITSGDENLSIFMTDEQHDNLIFEWNSWLNDQSPKDKGTLYQLESSILDEKISEFSKKLIDSFNQTIAENNKLFQSEIKKLQEQNKLLTETIQENQRQLKNTLETIMHFTADLSDIEDIYNKLEDDVFIQQNVLNDENQ